jgi:cephalosporin hydroxylase
VSGPRARSRTLLLALVAALAAFNLYQWLASDGPPAASREAPKPVAPAVARAPADPPIPKGAPADLNERRRLRPYVPDGRGFDRTWFGINTLQHPYDVWTTQEIIFQVKPDFIVETGTYKGGSAALWAGILEHANPDGRVITIDIEDVVESRELPIVKRRVEFLVGSSTDPAIVAKVAERVQGKKVLVILDSLHEAQHVAGELRAYAPLVSVGSYVIVQDTHLGDTVPFWWYEPPKDWIAGPLKAVEEFLASNDAFVADPTREGFASTNNRHGWLKRIR